MRTFIAHEVNHDLYLECIAQSFALGQCLAEWIEQAMFNRAMGYAQLEDSPFRSASLEDIYGDIHEAWENRTARSEMMEAIPRPTR